MVFALLAGFAFGLFTGQAHVAGLSMAWMALWGGFSRLRRSRRLDAGWRDWMWAYSLAATSRKRRA